MNTKSSLGWYRVLFIILAVLYIFAGIALIANPGYFAPFMIALIGWMAIVYGIVMIANYFMAVNFKSIWTLISGIILVVLGLLIVFHLFSASIALGILTGIGFLILGIYKIYQSFTVKALGVSGWWMVLILGICNLIVGCIMMFNLGSSAELLTILIGTNLLVNGVSDMMLAFTAF